MAAFIPAMPQNPHKIERVSNPLARLPAFVLAHYREHYRHDETISDARLAENATHAMLMLNADLSAFLMQHSALNPQQEALYLRAVYHRVKTYCLEQYRDVDVSRSGEKQAENMEARLRREQQREREVLRLLRGQKRTTVALL